MNGQSRTIVVGDIHGCYKEFIKLLETVYLDEESDRLILLGDLVDRGPDSYQVLIKVIELKERMGERFVCLMGNHEEMLIEAAEDNHERRFWYRNGGEKTAMSFLKAGKPVREYVSFFKELPLYHETEDWICVHAGISLYGPKKTSREIFLWDREIAYGELYTGKLLLYGHTPMESVVYQNEWGEAIPVMPNIWHKIPDKGSICLDTGCVFGGKLSAIVMEEGQYLVKEVIK